MRKTTSMKKIRELLRLVHEGLSQRKAATCSCISRTVAQEILSKAASHNLSWPLDETYTDAVLHNILFPKNIPKNSLNKKIPDWAEVQKELLKKAVTLTLLWTEYKEECPDGYQYSKYCEMFREWKKSTRLSMRQNHVAGEKMFIDFSGVTVEYVDRGTGEIKKAEIFLSVLGWHE
jgi:transposase